VPESGDSVQAMKAGLMEIADLFVVNKADREGADNAVREIEAIMELVPDRDGWHVPVLKTIASESQGIEELRGAIGRHHDYLRSHDRLSELRRLRIRKAVIGIVQEKLQAVVWNDSEASELLKKRVDDIMAGQGTPHSAAEDILEQKGLLK